MPDLSQDGNSDLIGVRDAARQLGVHENTIRNWVKSGLLKVSKNVGARDYKRFSRGDVERMRHEMLTQFAPATELPEPREAGNLSDAVPKVLRRVGSHAAVDAYVGRVVKDWESYWQERVDHRYGRDFHAFLGERILTDFNLRHHDRTGGHEPHGRRPNG